MQFNIGENKMTRAELIDLIKDKKWGIVRNSEINAWIEEIRCENGDCPIIAAYRRKFPTSKVQYPNSHWYLAAIALGLDQHEAAQIVMEADDASGTLLEELGIK